MDMRTGRRDGPPRRSTERPAMSTASSYNRDVLDDAYARWRDSPQSVDPTWQAFFAGVEFAGNGAARPAAPADLRLQTRVVRLVFWYRQAAHPQPYTNPPADGPPPGPDLSERPELPPAVL